MTDITTLQKAARVSMDENGEPVIQIPLALWDEFKASFEEPESQQPSQSDRIRAALQEIKHQAEEDPPNWGEDFRTFLKENRLDLTRKDLDVGGDE
jgi:hypothetical protein